MARTKASVGAKVSVGKSNKARCSVAPPSIPSTSGTSSKSSKSYSGGNPVCPRETPKWQKPITNFYTSTPASASKKLDTSNDDEQEAGPSKQFPKRNVIQSDNEDDLDVEEPPKNQVLEESILLEPLTGESSHKMDEYYTIKDKGQGKKSNKENVDVNANQSNGKRELEEVNDDEPDSKRIKIS